MRTTRSSAAVSLRFIAWVTSLGVAAAALVACADSLRLAPAGSTGSGGGASGPGAGGGGGAGHGGAGTGVTTGSGKSGCLSNVDCAFPKAHCDVPSATCFECFEVKDCALKPGTVCSQGACVCPHFDDASPADTFCAPLGNQTARCVDLTSVKEDCGLCGHHCFGACTGGSCADPWEPTSLIGAPQARTRHVAVWDVADQKMIVWGGSNGGPLNTGATYDPAKALWKPISTTNAPTARRDATVIWDDVHGRMIVWGGFGTIQGAADGAVGTGGMYDPKTDTWTKMSNDGAPGARFGHTAVWTGKAMLIWGGGDGTTHFGDGAPFDPAQNTWGAAFPKGPSARTGHVAVWDPAPATGGMIVWGGYGIDASAPMTPDNTFLGDGARFDLFGWTPISPSSAPSPRQLHTGIWTGTAMLVWGGRDGGSKNLSTGAKYQPDSWLPFNAPAPTEREAHSALWSKTLTKMIVWGGQNQDGLLDSGSMFDPASLNWSATALPVAPSARAHHTAVLEDPKDFMIIWGGDTASGPTDTGAVYTLK